MIDNEKSYGLLTAEFRAVWLTLAFCLIVQAAYSAIIHPWMLDDAFITFRYAENIVAGNGAVYNAGERVEGYTSFLWVMIMAAGKWAGFDIVRFSIILGHFFSLGCLLLLAFSHKFVEGLKKEFSIVGTLLLGTSLIFLPWGRSGMEVSLFTFLITLDVLYYLRIRVDLDLKKTMAIGFLCGLTTLTRPEGIVIFGVIAIDQLFSRKRENHPAILILAFCAIYMPFFLWRLSHYGYPLPNTFYVKVGFHASQVFRGIKYLTKFAIAGMAISLPIVDPVLILSWFGKYRKFSILTIIAGVYLLCVILIGGDSMPALRFIAPIMPVICLLSAIFISMLGQRKFVVIYVLAAILYSFGTSNFFYVYAQIKTDKAVEYGKDVGLWLKNNTASDITVALNAAGAIPYYSGLKTIDMLGLNDIHIAHHSAPTLGSGWPGHEKADASYILSKNPDLIILGSGYGTLIAGFPSDKQLFSNPQFFEDYGLKKIPMRAGHTLLIFDNRRNPALPDFEFSIDWQGPEVDSPISLTTSQ